MLRSLIFTLASACLLAGPVHAQEQDGLLPVEQAFVLNARLAGPDRIALDWQIAPDYFLYKQRIKVKTDQPGLELGTLELPSGTPKHDEFFGDVEIYHGALAASLPFTLNDAAARTVALKVTVQGCHETDPQICYPPHPTTLTLDLGSAPPMAEPVSPLAAKLGQGGPLSGALASIDGDAPLPPEEAFVFETITSSPTSLLARWSMPKGYYLYRDRSKVTVNAGNGVEVGAVQWPAGVDHEDEHFGTVVVYYDQVELSVPLRRESGAAQTIEVTGEFQGCKENGICYPVMQRQVKVDLDPASLDQLAAAAKTFVPVADVAAAATTASAEANPAAAKSSTSLGLLGALIGALLGGLVLNLMPCVLPVLSFKLIGLAGSGESLAKARRHAIWYTAGVLTAFAAVGLLVIALRSAGQALGWGFQLQQPGFVAVLVYVLLAVGLSLSGVFTMGAGLANAGQGLASRSGAAGDFFTGVLACVVASPCTAPMMGPALAFAFASSSWVALLIFLALGLGLALPFLIVGFVPALASRLPKPGAWMETLKQVLAFPMYLTAVWLVWVLGKQRGVDAIGLVLVGAVVLALGLWWYERARLRGRTAGRILAVLVMLAALAPLWMVSRLQPSAETKPQADTAEAYSRERLDALRGEGRTVFVNMTADWCVTCKVNEKNVLGSQRFADLLRETNAAYLKGDWTNVDPAITAFLQEHGAVGVPLYVVFHGKAGAGTVLPTVLTAGVVETALKAKTP